MACEAYGISETCYRYERALSDENAEISDWLIRLTTNQRNWGFGLCFLFRRNVKGYPWNHKRVYRIYRELELNLRIKPKKRIVREKPEPLTEPHAINECCSMDFMHDQLEDGRTFRLFNAVFFKIVVVLIVKLLSAVCSPRQGSGSLPRCAASCACYLSIDWDDDAELAGRPRPAS